MTEPIDRVWVALDRCGHPQFAAPWSEAAHEHINDAIDQHNPGAGGWVVREYRLHRPINWRTGVPDVETVGRCGNRFALLLTNGGLLRRARRHFGFWYWRPLEAYAGVALGDFDLAGWCPEDEMPEGEKT